MKKQRTEFKRKLTNQQQIIERFLNTENREKDFRFWKKEVALAVEMLEQHPLEFWMQLRDPFDCFKLSSLVWFKTEDGKKFVFNWFFEYQKEKTDLTTKIPEISLVPDKIGEDVVAPQPKPKTLKDFLNRYGKK